MDDELSGKSFYLEMAEGFSFRNLVVGLATFNVSGIFVFDCDGCSCLISDSKIHLGVSISDVAIITRLTIQQMYLTRYFFPESSKAVVVEVNLKEFKEKLASNIGKRDSLTIFQNVGDPRLYISKNQSDDLQYITTLVAKRVWEYAAPRYPAGLKRPSYVVSTEDLNKKFTAVYREIGAPDSTVTMMDDGECLKVDVASPQGSGSCIRILKTQSGAPSLEEPQVYKLNSVIARFLSRTSGLQRGGTVQFYTQTGLPLRIMCKVGTYGTLLAYIKNTTAEWAREQEEERGLKPCRHRKKRETPAESAGEEESRGPRCKSKARKTSKKS